MRLTWLVVATLSKILTLPSVQASFVRDVIRTDNAAITTKEAAIEDALLAKAVPLEDYKAQLAAQGLHISSNQRHLDEDANEDEDGDDYYLDGNYMYSFSGYSLKYAKCQPVQKFSEDAIKAGEYTPMIIDDIVILRLCPYRFCSPSRTFGCHYNFGEYAIGLSDYVRVMLRYTEDKNGQLCDWCASCYARRHLEEDEAEDEEDRDEDGDQGENEADDYYAANEEFDDDYANAYRNGDDAYADDACYDYQTYCYDEDGNSVCNQNDDDAEGSYMALEDYFEYLDCTRISDDENYGYYVKPRCDASEGTIKMAIFHDSFCSQYAGNEVSLKNFGLGFQDSVFEDFYESKSCIDCSESNSPPYFNANSNMCNRMHISGAKCIANMQYDLFDDESDDATECSFIESVRFGTYDESGQLYVEGSLYGGNANRQVTSGQKISLTVVILVVGVLALYSCYLHHSITNLLIKSLSHTDLLPPSRHKGSRRGRSSSKGRRGRKSRVAADDDEDDEDWDAGVA